VYDGGRVAEDFDVKDSGGRVLYRVNGAPDWQRRALEAVDKHGSRVSIRTANGAGKTQVLIPAMMFAHMCVFPNSRIVITSGVQRQVREQVFAVLKTQQGRFIGWEFQDTLIAAPNGSRCIGFSTDEGGKFTGWTTASWTPSPDSGHCSIQQGNNKLFICNGEGIRTWDGFNWGAMQSDYTEPLACPYLIHATNRLIAAGSSAFPDTVWFSNFLEEDKWSGVNSIRVGAGDGDPITGITLWTNTLLVVFKRSSVYLVDINPASQVGAFSIQTASTSIGCVGPRAFAKVGKDLWFYSDHGLRSLARVLEGQDTEVSPAISYPLSDVIAQVSESRLAEVCCYFYNDVFFMSLPLGSAGAAVLPVRLVAGAPRWLGTWTGAFEGGVSHFCRSYVGGVQRLNLAIGDRCYQWLDHVREVNESIATYMDSPSGEYPTEIVTRSMSFGDESLWKQGFTIEAEFNRSRGRVDLHAIRDGQTDEQPVLTADSGLAEGLQFAFTFPIQFPPTWERIKVNGTLMHTGRFRELALQCRANAGKLSLRKIQATAFAGSMHVEST